TRSKRDWSSDVCSSDLTDSAELGRLTSEVPKLRAEQAELSQQVVELRETAILQEVGVYEYRHPLDDAPSYKARLTGLQAQIKDRSEERRVGKEDRRERE